MYVYKIKAGKIFPAFILYYRFSKGIKDLFSATFLYAGRIIRLLSKFSSSIR